MRWRAIVNLYLPTGYVEAGDIFDTPADWRPPTNAVQPMGSDAVTRYWQEGPRGCSNAECWRQAWFNGNRWTGVPVGPPSTYWVKVEGGFVLKGAESLGIHPQV